MRKFLPLLLLLAALSLPAEDEVRSRFMRSYYDGNYTEAHALINQALPDTWLKQVWDARLHLQSDLPDCPLYDRATQAARGMALLMIGDFSEARDCFGEDWLSELGRATLAELESRRADARDAIQKAMMLSPDNPDLVYFAADVAPSREASLELFRQFLELPQADPYKKAVAEYSMEFMKKTWNLPLNVPVKIDGMESVDSEFRDGELRIHATINGREKVSLLLDTGAGGMTLKEGDWQPQLISDVMMIGVGKRQTVRSTRLVLNLFEAGHYQLKNPVAGMSASVPLAGADGIAGTSLFSYHYMLVPFKTGKNFTLFTCDAEDPVSCLESRGIHFSEKTTMPFYTVNRLMILKGRIGDSADDLDILLDTGAAHCILSTAAAKRYARINYPLSHRINPQSGISGIGGKTDDVLVAENIHLALGGLRKEVNRMVAMNLGESSEAMGLELHMILGRDFLQGYTLLIDY
ncbi:MAG TPA: hypothetical protein VLR94_08645, partial [Acidobacteriota bacterium]|nr:hypothetical protein [Acidobacteriota bacterium]